MNDSVTCIEVGMKGTGVSREVSWCKVSSKNADWENCQVWVGSDWLLDDMSWCSLFEVTGYISDVFKGCINGLAMKDVPSVTDDCPSWVNLK